MIGHGETSEAHQEAARSLLDSGRPARALERLDLAAGIEPGSAETQFLLATALHRLGRLDDSQAAAKRAIDLQPGHAEACNFLGALFAVRNRWIEAKPWMEAAVGLAPGVARFHRDAGVAQLFLGDIAAAKASLMRAAEIDPTADKVLYALARMTPMADDSREGRRILAILRTALDRAPAQPATLRAQLFYAAAKISEDLGRYQPAFDYLIQGAALRREAVDPDLDAIEMEVDRIIEVFDAACLQRLAGEGSPDGRPVFIIGMPRSGTTLIEQILAAHPLVHGAGEVPTLPNVVRNARDQMGAPFPDWGRTLGPGDCRKIADAYLQRLPHGAGGQVRTTDKRLDNASFVGLIAAILPRASLIYCRRDPRDVAFACLSVLFETGHEWSYSLDDIARYWRAHERLMAHWRAVLPPGRMLEIDYEAVVADVEGSARRLLAHIGLAWDDACLSFHKADRQVTSASAAQVREPIYDRSVGRWKPFAGRLAPMFEAMGLNAQISAALGTN